MVRLSTASIERQPVGSTETFSLTLTDWPGALAAFAAEGTVSRLESGLALTVRAAWLAQGSCARCLRDVTVAVGGESSAPTIAAEPGETWLPVVDQEIDLTPLLEEIEVLSWPTRVLCQDACRGLCPSCGKDLNQGACQCRPEAQPGPFEGLRDLLGKED